MTEFGDNQPVVDKTEDEIKKAEQYEALKRMLMRLLDDPQIQQKMIAVIRRHLGQEK